MFGYVTFNGKYCILSQLFYKKIGWELNCNQNQKETNYVFPFFFGGFELYSLMGLNREQMLKVMDDLCKRVSSVSKVGQN